MEETVDIGSIQLHLVGRPGNRSGIGASVQVVTGEQVRHGRVRSGGNYLSHNDLRLHFGLGKSEQVDRIKIHWPSGQRETLENIKAGPILTIVKGESIGSHYRGRPGKLFNYLVQECRQS